MYRKFSQLYDALTFDIDYDFYFENIVRILESRDICAKNLLEIGCGTGNMTRRLADLDLEITAIDNSMPMLNEAYGKLIGRKNVSLVYKDMFEFEYDQFEYDLVVSLLDVINYVLDEDDLLDLFTKVKSTLSEGGLFIFDLNTEYKLKELLGDKSYVYEHDNIFYTWENQMDGDLVDFYLNFFVEEEDGSYRRIEEIQTERYYSLAEISRLLKKAGFKEIHYFDEDTGKSMNKKTQRLLIFAI